MLERRRVLQGLGGVFALPPPGWCRDPLPRRNPAWQNKFDPALGCIDPQPHPPGPRADPDRYRNADFWIAVESNRPQVTSQVRTPSFPLSDATPLM